MTQSTRSARADWEARIGLRSDAEAGLELPLLAAPASLRASPGRGQVTLDWQPVEGAAGYVIERAAAPDGPWDLLEIGEPEVRPVPHPPYADTAGAPGSPAWYRVAAAASVRISTSRGLTRCPPPLRSAATRASRSPSGPTPRADASIGPGGR
jgi:xylan 1,4-beta-xylosidase